MAESKQIKLLQGIYINNIIKSVGLRAYPLIAPEKVGNDYIVYQRNTLNNIETKGRLQVYSTEAQYTITVVSDNYANSLSNAEKLLSALTDYQSDDVSDIQILNCSEAFSNDYYLQAIQIKLITK